MADLVPEVVHACSRAGILTCSGTGYDVVATVPMAVENWRRPPTVGVAGLCPECRALGFRVLGF